MAKHMQDDPLMSTVDLTALHHALSLLLASFQYLQSETCFFEPSDLPSLSQQRLDPFSKEKPKVAVIRPRWLELDDNLLARNNLR